MNKTLINILTAMGALVSLMGAIYIYVTNRSLDMSLYSWFNINTDGEIFTGMRGHSRDYTSWVKYNLPDGLWLLSYLLFIESIWDREKMIKWIFCIPVILFALLSEILQYKSYIFGTGDIIDIVFYAVGILLFILLIKLKKMYYEKNN